MIHICPALGTLLTLWFRSFADRKKNLQANQVTVMSTDRKWAAPRFIQAFGWSDEVLYRDKLRWNFLQFPQPFSQTLSHHQLPFWIHFLLLLWLSSWIAEITVLYEMMVVVNLSFDLSLSPNHTSVELMSSGSSLVQTKDSVQHDVLPTESCKTIQIKVQHLQKLCVDA